MSSDFVWESPGVRPVELARIADLWEENQEYLKQQIGESDSARFGARWVYMPEVPFPKFNHVSKIRVDSAQIDALVDAARNYFRSRGLSACTLMVTPATTPEGLGERLYRMGFMREVNPVMLWDGSSMPMANPAIRVERVGRERATVVFDMIRRVFFPTASDRMLAMARRGVDVSFQLEAVNYLAYYQGAPVGAGMLFARGGMAGVYNMCTLPEYRGLGVATAVLEAIFADAPLLDCQHVGLTPTVMGRPLYERLGFRELYQEHYYVQRLT